MQLEPHKSVSVTDKIAKPLSYHPLHPLAQFQSPVTHQSDMSNDICGLYILAPDEYGYPHRKYLPQVAIKSHATISATSYATKLRQTFINPSDERQTEATYAFPLYDGVAVTSFTCTIGERKIVGHVEGKQQAHQTYQDAVDRGESAGLLDSLPAGIFNISVGGIPPRSNIVVDLEYGAELKHDAQFDGIRYTLPLSIAPRYGKYPGEVLTAGMGSSQERGIQIDVDFDLDGLSVQSLHTTSSTFQPLLTTQLKATRDGRNLAGTATVHLTGSEMDEDFVLVAQVDGSGAPQATVETDKECSTVMATFVPKFKLPNIQPEIVFIVDQSGSMEGSKTAALIDALTIFLKSLPNDVHFNVCAFGTRHEFIFEKSQPYNQTTATKALDFVKTFNAQYGGTELQIPIEKTFERHSGDTPLEVIVLSDGEIWQEQELFDFINGKIVHDGVDARMFCLGIGSDVSHTLIEGVARAGRGVAQFVTEEENLDQKVVRMLKSALSPHFKDVKIKLNYDEEDFEMVDGKEATNEEKDTTTLLSKDEKASTSLFDTSANLDKPIAGSDADVLNKTKVDIDPYSFTTPYHIPLLPFNRTTVYCMTPPNAYPPSSLTLTAISSSGPLSLDVPIKSLSTPSSILRKLAARTHINDLEAGSCLPSLKAKLISPSSQADVLESAITLLGTTHQIPSKYTSFVAVDDESSSLTTTTTSTTSTTTTTKLVQKKNKRRGPKPSNTATGDGQQKPLVRYQRAMPRSMVRNRGLMMQMAPSPSMCAVPPPPPGAMPSGALFGATSSLVGGPQQATSGPPAPSPASSASLFGANTGGSGNAPGGLFGSLRSSVGGSFGGFGSAAPTPAQQPYVAQEPEIDVTTLSEEQRLRIIIAEQSFDGYWEWSEKLIKVLMGPESNVKGSSDKIITTLLVMEALKTKFSRLEEIWELCTDKAEAWLASNVDAERRARLTSRIQTESFAS